MKKSNWNIFGLVCAFLVAPVQGGVAAVVKDGKHSISVDVSGAPNNSLEIILHSIQSAQESILVNIYEFTSPEIAAALMQKISEGVTVQILEEGQPVGGMSAEGRQVQKKIVAAMKKAGKKNRFFEMTAKSVKARRFHFDHAKYMVIDEDRVVVGSENYSATGAPKAGVVGNRGWVVCVHDRDMNQQFRKLFSEDSKLTFHDVIDLTSQKATEDVEDSVEASEVSAAKSTFQTFEADEIYQFDSPDSSLKGLQDLIGSARSNLEIELMSFYPSWGQDKPTSPLLKAVLDAARKGIKVRVLLNDERVFGMTDPAKMKNRITIDLLNKAAAKEKLDITAKTANLLAMQVTYIHNKGILVDEDKTLVSSINWGSNSVEQNREAAVVLVSSSIHNHFKSIFENDWKAGNGGDQRSRQNLNQYSPFGLFNELEDAARQWKGFYGFSREDLSAFD